MLEIKKKDLLINSYSNISELYNWLQKTQRRPTARKRSESTDDINFYGTRSLEESYDMLIHSDEKLYKEIDEINRKIDITKIIGNKISRRKEKQDVVGYQPNVPLYLMGTPENMINQEPKKISQKILNICLNVSVNWSISKQQIKNAGSIYAKTIDILEKMGYRCNLYILSVAQVYSETAYCLVKVKTDREPFNLKKLCFLMANSGYDRRIIFKWLECCKMDNEITEYSYGRPITDKALITNTLRKHLKIEPIIWNIQSENKTVEIDKILEDLENQGIKIKEV